MIAALYVVQAIGYVLIGVGFWMLLRLAGEVRDTRQQLNRQRINVGRGVIEIRGEPVSQDQADALRKAFRSYDSHADRKGL